MVPITRSISACRGEKLIRSEPKRPMSYVAAIVAIYSIPQHEVANGKGHIELARANPTTSLNLVAKNPSPAYPSGGATCFISDELLIIFNIIRILNFFS